MITFLTTFLAIVGALALIMLFIYLLIRYTGNKTQKTNELFDKCVENCDPATMKEVSDNVDKVLQKEQK